MTKEEIIRMAREAGFDSAHLTRFAELVFEQGRQEGVKQERALWELSKLGQEIEAQPEQDDRRLQIAMRQWEDWKAYALELQKKLVKYEGGSPMILNTQPEQYTDIVSNGGLGPRNKFDAQPEQEPVLCQYAVDVAMPEYRCAGKCQYTHPQQRPWVGLTDDEVIAASAIATYMDDLDAWTFARTIEDKLKEKNT